MPCLQGHAASPPPQLHANNQPPAEAGPAVPHLDLDPRQLPVCKMAPTPPTPCPCDCGPDDATIAAYYSLEEQQQHSARPSPTVTIMPSADAKDVAAHPVSLAPSLLSHALSAASSLQPAASAQLPAGGALTAVEEERLQPLLDDGCSPRQRTGGVACLCTGPVCIFLVQASRRSRITSSTSQVAASSRTMGNMGPAPRQGGVWRR